MSDFIWPEPALVEFCARIIDEHCGGDFTALLCAVTETRAGGLHSSSELDEYASIVENMAGGRVEAMGAVLEAHEPGTMRDGWAAVVAHDTAPRVIGAFEQLLSEGGIDL